jgi:Erv1 / Alr family
MDTRFWGPSGWKLLHLATFTFEYSAANAVTYSRFFETIPYILPCKFCRSSLIDFYKEHPFTIKNHENGMINPMLNLTKWMYTIHNCVNNKLRKQGLHSAANPTFASVTKTYTALTSEPWTTQLALLWDFLFAVAYNHPKQTFADAKPMPDCPKEAYTCKDKCIKNKWNILPLKDRIYWFKRFWLYLPVILPSEIAKRWQAIEKTDPPALQCRRSTLAWLWRMRCKLDTEFKDPYTSICKKIGSYSSDCEKKRNITCRKRK